ncbi:hypothetical protein FSP39_000347 [Pinctada imbricata]|uniref:C2H2-type domain-containing protein n=1 Tax=Pinctada imbricata TaxID=66713 RepID=A0AA89C4L6_PINIB|nr:hypothetical protein FSP39_000347 [Pinctada imbricata]
MESCTHGHSLSTKHITYEENGREEKIFECNDCGEHFSKVTWTVKRYQDQMYLIKQDRARKLLIKAKLYYADKPRSRIRELHGITKKIRQKNKKPNKLIINEGLENDPSASQPKAEALKRVKKCMDAKKKKSAQEEKIRSKLSPKSKKIPKESQMKDIEIKVKEYSCSICLAVFFNNVLYRSHLATHTHCFHCDKVFKAYENLRRHLKTHATNQDYVCSVCGKTFKAQQNLSKHKLIHREDSDCACSICGKVFKAKPNLQKHMVTHNDTLSFCCDICGKGFKAMQNLQVNASVI